MWMQFREENKEKGQEKSQEQKEISICTQSNYRNADWTILWFELTPAL